LVRANKMFPGEMCFMIRTNAELSTCLVDSWANCCSVKCHRSITVGLCISGCNGVGSCCAETAAVPDAGHICPVLSLSETASREIFPPWTCMTCVHVYRPTLLCITAAGCHTKWGNSWLVNAEACR
jgi:hypothetical protein